MKGERATKNGKDAGHSVHGQAKQGKLKGRIRSIHFAHVGGRESVGSQVCVCVLEAREAAPGVGLRGNKDLRAMLGNLRRSDSVDLLWASEWEFVCLRSGAAPA